MPTAIAAPAIPRLQPGKRVSIRVQRLWRSRALIGLILIYPWIALLALLLRSQRSAPMEP